MGDCLPQPWGNLGICLMMQERYDEAEAALKRDTPLLKAIWQLFLKYAGLAHRQGLI